EPLTIRLQGVTGRSTRFTYDHTFWKLRFGQGHTEVGACRAGAILREPEAQLQIHLPGVRDVGRRP
nr:hypothetical protein [Acidobacteriota bacterium]